MKLQRVGLDGVPYVEVVALEKGDLVRFANTPGLYKFKKEVEFEDFIEGLDVVGELSFGLQNPLEFTEVADNETLKGTYLLEGKAYKVNKPVSKNLIVDLNGEVLKITEIVKGETKQDPSTLKVERLACKTLHPMYPVYVRDSRHNVSAYGVYEDLAEAYIMVGKLRETNVKAHM